MKHILTFISAFFICLSGQTQKVYWKSMNQQLCAPYGGIKAAKAMIKREFVYPNSAIIQDVEGSVSINYGIKQNGEVVISSISGSTQKDLRAETLRLFKKLRFKPTKARAFLEGSERFSLSFSKKDWVKLSNKRGYKAIEYVYTPVDTSGNLYPYQKLQNKPYPIFSGKEKYNSYLDYIANKLQFPTEALKLNLKGEVVVTFVIEPSGFISNLEVLKKMPAGCTEEAVRLIEELHWHPAIKNEQAVRTIMITSVGFGVSSSTFHGAFNQGLNGR